MKICIIESLFSKFLIKGYVMMVWLVVVIILMGCGDFFEFIISEICEFYSEICLDLSLDVCCCGE